MKPTPLKAPPLCDLKKPWCAVRFVDDDGNRKYHSGVSVLTGHRMSAFDSNAPIIRQTVPEIRRVLRKILERDPSAEIIGTLKP